MLEKLAAILPPSMLVKIWQMLPDSIGLKRFLAWRANARFAGGVMGLVYAKNGDLLIVKHTYKKIPWGLPSGALKREQPAEGLKREIFEETGFAAEPVKVLDTVFSPGPPELLVIIEAKLIGGLFVPSPEVSDFRFINPNGNLNMLPKRQQKIIKMYGKNKYR